MSGFPVWWAAKRAREARRGELELLVENLRSYNRWRRGDEEISQPEPVDVGRWIDGACDLLGLLEDLACRYERERDEARANVESLRQERDEARQERDIARLERDEAIADYQRVYEERDEAVAECKSLWSLVNANKLRAYKAERERDEAREALSAAKHYLTKERDEALAQIVQAECRAERFCQERDEAREKALEEAAK